MVRRPFTIATSELTELREYYTNENLCEVYMETKNGANCYVSVQCNDGKREYNAGGATWNVCYLGGRQYFNDPRIGDFSVTFTEKDGIDGEGLTGPVLQVKEIGNWQEIHAKDLAYQKEKDEDCKKHNGLKCGKGPYVCSWLDYNQENGRTRKWKCGVPKRGMKFPGLESNMPVNDRGFAPGWCGVHITQWQTPNALETKVFDANQAEIGNSGGKQGDKLKFGSKLPLWFLVDGSAGSDKPIKFEYDAQFWDTNDKDKHHCSVGAYDGGKREIDCGYTCK
ncbi:hypothetical protein IQ06DRAFT_313192 [Phaeosphaeriaceae sp. SRC1lsM3a]|nr:hypothetical protein IQ06DRAFT_313192 [Stagonospora sp. SRC1lsM3a]